MQFFLNSSGCRIRFRSRKFVINFFFLILCFINCEINVNVINVFPTHNAYIFKSVFKLNYVQ